MAILSVNGRRWHNFPAWVPDAKAHGFVVNPSRRTISSPGAAAREPLNLENATCPRGLLQRLDTHHSLVGMGGSLSQVVQGIEKLCRPSSQRRRAPTTPNPRSP